MLQNDAQDVSEVMRNKI